MSFAVSAMLVVVVTAVACALPGAFVVLRRSSMLVDAMAHAVLPGIVLGYAITRDLSSPWLVVGAALAGMLVVVGEERLRRSGLVAGDAPVALVFPSLFAIGVLLVSSRFEHVHIDVEAVLVGDANVAAATPLVLAGVDVGPAQLWFMFGLLAVEAVVLGLVARPLSAATFDRAFAVVAMRGIGALELGVMLLVSVTVTAAFRAAGAVLVLAMVVAPAATARLLVRRLGPLVAATAAIAALGSAAGFWTAYALDAASSAGIAVVLGLVFAAVLAGARVRERMRRTAARRRASALC